MFLLGPPMRFFAPMAPFLFFFNKKDLNHLVFRPNVVEEVELGSESDGEDESTLSNLSPEEIRQREKTKEDKGTASTETEAGAEISALVNYVQPIHFHSFEHAESNILNSFIHPPLFFSPLLPSPRLPSFFLLIY